MIIIIKVINNNYKIMHHTNIKFVESFPITKIPALLLNRVLHTFLYKQLR